MKKLIALLLTAIMALGCLAAFAEEVVVSTATDTIIEPIIIQSSTGKYELTFHLPEDGEVVSDISSEDSFQASIQKKDGSRLYLSVYKNPVNEDDELGTITFNETSGYTDEFLKNMANDMYKDEVDDYELDILPTAYGTKLIVIRVNDSESPYAYMWTVWNDYEIGLTISNVAEDGSYIPVTDKMIADSVAFMSDLWVYDKPAE